MFIFDAGVKLVEGVRSMLGENMFSMAAVFAFQSSGEFPLYDHLDGGSGGFNGRRHWMREI